MRACSVVQVRNQKPIVSNPKKFDIDGTPGMVGQSGSTRIWRNTANGFDYDGARIMSRRGRWSYRAGGSTKNAAGEWKSEVRRDSCHKDCSGRPDFGRPGRPRLGATAV